MIGKILGYYQITSWLDKGSMGAVYRAKDHKPDQDLIFKVQLEEFAKDGCRVARFRREAKLPASLNYHNIAARDDCY
jgi:serine/threonine protein kinase